MLMFDLFFGGKGSTILLFVQQILEKSYKKPIIL